MGSLLKSALDRFIAAMSPVQVCWLCLVSTLCIGYILSTQYVRADELQDIKTEIRALTLSSLEQKILDARKGECSAGTGGRSFYRERVTELSRRYFQLTGIGMSLPSCAEI